MGTPIFPNKTELFYGNGDYYLGNNRIFNPYMNVGSLTPRQRLFRQHPLLNYGMSLPRDLPSEDKPMTNNHRFLSQVCLVLNTACYLGDIRGKHILEVGSGTGCGAYFVDNEFRPASLHGVDFSPEQMERAREMNAGKAHMNFHILNAGDITFFGDDQFDGIYSVEMAQHLNKQTLQYFIEGAFETLRPEKKLAFSTFFSQSEGAQAELRKLFPTVDMGLDYMHNIDDVKSIMEQTGFKNVLAMSIGKYVWGQLVRWCKQVAPEQTWSDAYLKAFPQLLDYYIVTGRKG